MPVSSRLVFTRRFWRIRETFRRVLLRMLYTLTWHKAKQSVAVETALAASHLVFTRLKAGPVALSREPHMAAVWRVTGRNEFLLEHGVAKIYELWAQVLAISKVLDEKIY